MEINVAVPVHDVGLVIIFVHMAPDCNIAQQPAQPRRFVLLGYWDGLEVMC